MHTLIAHPFPIIRRVLEDALAGRGHTFDSVDRAADLLEAVRRRPPQLVLLDWGLARDPVALCAKLRAALDGAPTQLVAIVRRGDEEREASQDAGVDGCLPLPLDPAAIDARIAMAERAARARPASPPPTEISTARAIRARRRTDPLYAFRRASATPAAAIAVAVAAPTPAAAARRTRVLAIDDQPLILVTLRRILGREHEVVTATSAEEALALLAAGPPFDAAICDVSLPGMDGVDFYRELTRAAPALAERTLFLTGGACNPRARAFLEEMRGRRVDKPFHPDDLRARIRERLDA